MKNKFSNLLSVLGTDSELLEATFQAFDKFESIFQIYDEVITKICGGGLIMYEDDLEIANVIVAVAAYDPEHAIDWLINLTAAVQFEADWMAEKSLTCRLLPKNCTVSFLRGYTLGIIQVQNLLDDILDKDIGYTEALIPDLVEIFFLNVDYDGHSGGKGFSKEYDDELAKAIKTFCLRAGAHRPQFVRQFFADIEHELSHAKKYQFKGEQIRSLGILLFQRLFYGWADLILDVGRAHDGLIIISSVVIGGTDAAVEANKAV